ncbi:MAG: hypothetical protein NZ853_04230 [Leptospiraceae bacterium]|nr:hypothetical protein [Leptospiraceae bacterium]MDW7975381.1 hypothetical protein [Leptospiraceae bacterium]
MIKFRWIILLVSFFSYFSYCATVNEVVNPLQNPLTSWIFDKSCISVDVPPITLTSEKTAIEKQILGEKTELVPEGWIITSSNFVNPIREKQLTIYEEIREPLEKLELYKSMMEYYMLRDYIGIDGFGNFLLVPETYRKTTDFKHLELAQQGILIMNQNKEKVVLFLQKKDQQLAQSFLESYKKSFRHLGWNYDPKIGWYKR